MSHSTVSHRWFHQIGNQRTNENAYDSGNMFYNEKIIYSYGKHFALAIRFENIVVINSKSYSNSTAKHFGHVQNSIDTFSHKRVYVPFKEAYYMRSDIDFKDVYKHIDFADFVYDFETNVKKLGNARKPEIYTSNIESLKTKLNEIFKLWRGSKTLALKTKGIRSILSFEFNESVKKKMLNLRKLELAKIAKRKELRKKEVIEDLLKYEKCEKNYINRLDVLGLNTVIRVKNDFIETSKGMKVYLNDGIRVFKLWANGKAIGTEVTTKDGHRWNCTKANGIIKFGCHEIDYKQAERVLKPYL